MYQLAVFDVAPDPGGAVLLGIGLIASIAIALLVLTIVVVAIILIVHALRKKNRQQNVPRDPYRQ